MVLLPFAFKQGYIHTSAGMVYCLLQLKKGTYTLWSISHWLWFAVPLAEEGTLML